MDPACRWKFRTLLLEKKEEHLKSAIDATYLSQTEKIKPSISRREK